MVVYIAMDQMVGDRRSPGAKILRERYRLPHPPTIALLPPTGSEGRDAFWTVYEMAGPVLPDGFDVAASLVVLTVEAAAFRIGLDVAASLKPAVAAEATGKRKALRRP